jgi:hypothetical protein
MLEKIVFFSFLTFVAGLFYFFDFQERNQMRTYHLCQDVITREWLVPLTNHQYKTLKETYADFNSMYFCEEKQYTRYHVNLMRSRKR